MTRQTRIRLFFVLILVGLVAGALSTPTYAAPCCSACDGQYNACVAGTLWYSICQGLDTCCASQVGHCYTICNYIC